MNLLGVTFGSTELALTVAIVVLLIILVFLAVAEMGLSRMTKPKAAAIADQGHRSGRALETLVRQPERWVNTILLTVNICQTVQATLTTILAKSLFGVWGVVVGVVISVVVFFVIAEALPKTYAVLNPERAALITARPTLALVRFPLLRWASQLMISLTNVIMPGKGLEKGPFLSEQELLGIVEAAADDDVIEQRERQLIESIIEFGDTVAREIMVPRPDMVTVDAERSISEALDIAIEHGYSRLPVLAGDPEDVVGLAYTKDLIKAERSGHGQELVSSAARQVTFIPENKPVSHLMKEMQERKFHLAMVVDEYGGVVGIVTLEDCLEELVGDIVDEYDNEEAEYTRLPDGEYLIDGAMSVGEVAELLDADLPDDGWDTLAGFVFGTLGHVPEPGDAVEADGWRFAAEVVNGRRIRQVRVSVVPTAESGEDETADKETEDA
jgi:CBS domain containing-hemolysin-like protein